MNHFWKRWKSEYLLEVRGHHCYNTGKPDAKPVSKGDVVLVHDDKPRGFWRLARVLKTVTGHDGRIRGAVLKVSSPTGRPSTLRRPLQLLYPLEMSSQLDLDSPIRDPHTDLSSGRDSLSSTERGENVVGESDRLLNGPSTISGRPKRASAIRARGTLQDWIAQEAELDECDTELDM